jgi:hypothetical protein
MFNEKLNEIAMHCCRRAKQYFYEPNDCVLRKNVITSLSSLLIGYQIIREIRDWQVVCDETNNTPSRIDQNILTFDIYLTTHNSIYPYYFRYPDDMKITETEPFIDASEAPLFDEKDF